jgi:hypothetical protein
VLALLMGTENDQDLDQDLAITLRVSDETGIVCTNDQPINDPGLLSQFAATESYVIRCDLTDPNVEAGGNKFASLANDANPDGDVLISLTPALASDQESPALDFVWTCGNPLNEVFQTETATCTYSTEGSFTVTLTVTNACGRTAEDTLVVNINP